MNKLTALICHYFNGALGEYNCVNKWSKDHGKIFTQDEIDKFVSQLEDALLCKDESDLRFRITSTSHQRTKAFTFVTRRHHANVILTSVYRKHQHRYEHSLT